MGRNLTQGGAAARNGARPVLLVVACALAVLPALPGCHGNQVRLRAAPHSNRYVWRRPVEGGRLQQGCRDLFYAVDPPLGYARARTSEPQGFLFNARLRWNATVRPVCAGLGELGRRHNQALISVAEFEQQKQSLDAAVGELAEIKGRLDGALEAYQVVRETIVRAGAVRAANGRSRQTLRALHAAWIDVEDIISEATRFVATVTGDGQAGD